jgi:ketosteroid isomerase-like protein
MSQAPHPNARVVEEFYGVQRRFYAGEDTADELRGLLSEDVAWHVPGRSPIAGHYRGRDAVLAYFADRRDRASATFRVQPRGMLADDERVVHFAGGRAERGGRTWEWETIGVFRVEAGQIAECWLVPFDQYAFDEIWS